jgi:hypothetical protein
MKNIVTIAGILALAITGFSQTIWIANNNVGAVPGTNVKLGTTALADAIASAAPGDIIYVVPSEDPYGSVTVNKSLNIFGAGFNPDKSNSMTSMVTNITITTNNVRISGLLVFPQVHVMGVSGTIVDKCRVDRILLTDIGSTIIQNCVIEGSSSFISINCNGTTNNLRINNNIIYGTAQGLLKVSNATIENNVFVGLTIVPDYSAIRDSQGCSIRNNIFYGVQPNGPNLVNNNQQFNLSFGATDNTFVDGVDGNTASNNIVNQDPLFVNLPIALSASSYSNSYDAHLKTGSPAKGTGMGGIDMGVFGGTTPFDRFGTSLPIVQTIVAPSSVVQGTNVNVRVQAKGN